MAPLSQHTLTQYQIDAFTPTLFKGNPAAVIILEPPLPEDLMQSIAMENNQSETAFLIPAISKANAYNIRWFTPTAEIGFCGHASLAAAHALFTQQGKAQSEAQTYHFHGPDIGWITVDASQGASDSSPVYSLTAPIAPAQTTPLTQAIRRAFPMPLSGAFNAGGNLYIAAQRASDVEGFNPDFNAILPLSSHGVGLTAKGGRDSAHCTSRFFVPAMGINEDPVTGSAHTAIGPYWAQILGMTQLRAYQASKRGGWIDIAVKTDTVTLSGSAVTYSVSQISLP